MSKALDETLNMPRGNCKCGRWLTLPPGFTEEDPLTCDCKRQWYAESILESDGRTLVEVKMVHGVLMPALILDLDGTVRYSKSGDFINKPEDVAIYDDVEDVLHDYRRDGYLIYGATNQGGVAFGFKTLESVLAEFDMMYKCFELNPFISVSYSVMHPGGTVAPYNHRSLFRKPYIGMLVQCEYTAYGDGYLIDWDNSIFVGDRPEDEQCAKNANVKFILADHFFGREPWDQWKEDSIESRESYFGGQGED